jgi:anaerobic ribonucleoside-triphosphate reductase
MVINTINNITLNVIWHEIVAELNKYNSFNNSIMNKEQFHSIYNSVKEKTEKLKASKDMDLYNFVNKFIQKLNKDYDASHILYLSGLEDMLQTNKIKYNKTKLWSELTLEIES